MCRHNDCSRNWVLILVGVDILWEEEGFQFGFKRWQGWAVSNSVCGSEFQLWHPKQGKLWKPWVLHLYCWIFSIRVSEEERHWHSGCNDTDADTVCNGTDCNADTAMTPMLTLFAMTLTLYPHEAPPGRTPYSCHCLLVGPVPGLLSSSHPLPHPPLPLGPTAQHLKANEMRYITGFVVTSNFWYLTNYQLRSAYAWTKSVIH